MKPGVASICIPTYAAEGFIERTIGCALSQTYPLTQVIVSVDRCDDRTLELCKSAALADSRIHVIEQTRRLGWSQNVNAALDRVDTEFAFVYFHDDIIEPTYVERLVAALVSEPAAVSAHCDLEEFGLLAYIKKAHDYRGSSLERLADFLMTSQGTTLRSMMRMSAVPSNVRYPHIAGDNRWTAYAFHIALLAAGPAVAVPETLYRRWQRPGSLTRSEGWHATTLDETIASIRAAAPVYLDAVERAISAQDQLIVARYCLRLFLTRNLLDEQMRLRTGPLVDIARLIPALDDGVARLLPNVLRPDTEGLLRDYEGHIDRLAADLATIGNGEGAAARL